MIQVIAADGAQRGTYPEIVAAQRKKGMVVDGLNKALRLQLYSARSPGIATSPEESYSDR